VREYKRVKNILFLCVGRVSPL